MRTAAFFDLDRTLLTVNSGKLWVDHERREGRITGLQVLDAAVTLLAYRLGAVDFEAATRRALRIYRGELEDTLAGWTRAWFWRV